MLNDCECSKPKDLDKAVIEPLREVFPADDSGEIKLVQAHSCVYGGRRFAHVILRRGNHIVSVLITDADSPDEFGGKIVNQANENLQVAGFRTKNHAIFIISNLSLEENSTVANAVIPSVQKHIEKFEA